MSSTSFAEGQLKSLVERIERLEEEKKAIAADIKEVYAEAKGNGFDVKILRKIISIRKMEAEDRQEQEAMIDLYMAALGMQPSLFDGEPEPNPETPASQKHAQWHEPAAMAVPQGSEKPDPITEPTSSLLSAGDGGPLTNDPETGDLCAGSEVILESKSPDPAEPFPELPAFMDRRPKQKPEYSAADYLAAG